MPPAFFPKKQIMKIRFLLLAVALAVAVHAHNGAETEYYDNGNGLVSFYVYRVHDSVQMLQNDNAASPGGEIGFLSNEYGYSDGVISRDCVVMYNNSQGFSSYQCCNGGSCSGCGYSGSGNGPANMPGRSYQLYPPPGAPASCNQNDACSGVAGVSCGGQCSGWWYSFQSQGNCAAGQNPSASGCSWYNSAIMETVQFASLVASGKFFTCESWVLPNNGPAGGCSGYLGWTPFMSGVDALLDLFETSAVPVILDPTTQTFVNVTGAPASPSPEYQCRAPCPPGSFSNTGFLSFNDQCQYCAAGSYSSHHASTSCSPCPGGGSSPAGANSVSQCTGGSSSSSDGDADADGGDGSLMADNAQGSVAKGKGRSLPAYAIAVAVISSLFVAAAVGIIVVRAIRRRGMSQLLDVEMQNNRI